MAHHITTRTTSGGIETCTHRDTGLSATHLTDALSILCRKLAALGATGPAEVRGEDGRLRLTVRALERLAKLTLVEHERRGLRWRRYVPFAKSRPAALASAS
jgi:hypothetical protein